MSDQTKAVVSIAEMARMVGLSRGRFYQLIGTTFPAPIYDVATKRPFYPEELQLVCLEVRRRNCGIDGKPVLFYARRTTIAPKKGGSRPGAVKPRHDDHADLCEGLKYLGLVTVTSAEVESAIKTLYPSGVGQTSQGEVLRALFLHLRAQGSGR
jgi:hypothetical protein